MTLWSRINFDLNFIDTVNGVYIDEIIVEWVAESFI